MAKRSTVHALAGVAAALVVGVAVTSCSSSTSTAKSTTTTAPPQATTTVAPTTTAAAAPGVGSTQTVNGGATVQLIAFGPDTGNGILNPPAGSSLVSATVQGCASSSSSESFNPLYFKLKMADNTTSNAALGEIDGQIDSSDQAPGSCVRGKVGFEVPSGETPKTLIFQTLTGNPYSWSVPA